MRRARIAAVFLTLILGLSAPGVSRAIQTDTKMSSIGILDYTRKPTFKVGDYVRYLVSKTDGTGSVLERYYLTVLIPGQEVFWGERCFWVETWADQDSIHPLTVTLTLMSYDIFNDSLPQDHLQEYERKTADDLDPQTGDLAESPVLPPMASLTARPTPTTQRTVDTLAVDTTQCPVGTFRSRVIVEHRGVSLTASQGDSTFVKERREDHFVWPVSEIPLTGNVRDEFRFHETRRAWMVGHSKEGTPEQSIGSGKVVARLIAYGHGMKSRMMPPARARSFDDPPYVKKAAPASKAAAPKAPAGGATKR